MPRNWTTLADRSDLYEEQDFQRAAYQLVCAQVLYESDQTQRVAYRLITQYRDAFEEAVKLFGMTLTFDDNARYVAATPLFASRRTALNLMESQLVLVLRKLYHEQASRGSLEDGAVAVVTIDDLRSAFKAATDRELPASAKDIGTLTEQMHRYGIARQVTAESDSFQPFDVAILPGIQTLVNEATLMRLASHYREAAALARVRRGDHASAEESATEGEGEPPSIEADGKHAEGAETAEDGNPAEDLGPSYDGPPEEGGLSAEAEDEEQGARA